MAVRIRLQRHGRRNRPFYRIVAADARAPRDGRAIETLGIYDPVGTTGSRDPVRIDAARVNYWLGVGAQPTHTVAILLKKQGIVPPWKRGSAPRRAAAAAGGSPTPAAPAPEAAARKAAAVAAKADKQAAAAARQKAAELGLGTKKAKREAKKARS
ncbi:MAG: hypothetical protein KatS3mg102_0431 [Planctomycetota bacterium]|nr:MAG: hypothetical protein KatS3mg102_0431 [Planctomycetota bacterium]